MSDETQVTQTVEPQSTGEEALVIKGAHFLLAAAQLIIAGLTAEHGQTDDDFRAITAARTEMEKYAKEKGAPVDLVGEMEIHQQMNEFYAKALVARMKQQEGGVGTDVPITVVGSA